MATEKIAIIGGGAAGTSAAWMLYKTHDVTLFEAQGRLGGHAYTEHLRTADGPAHVDMAVEYFNERLSPNLMAMHNLFGIETYVAPLSFRAVLPGQDMEWSNLHTKGGVRAKMGPEFDRFHLDMAQVLSAGEARYKKMSIGDFMRERGYSDDFMCQALLPLMTTFSGCNAPSLEYNLMYVAISFNMSLLSFFSPGYWRKAQGGIDGYVRHIAGLLGERVRLNAGVTSVRHGADGRVEVSTARGIERFDQVIFATHADVTLSLIEAPSEAHKDVLSRFAYVDTRSVMHSDASILAPGGSGEYCEFSLGEQAREPQSPTRYGQTTRINNNLQRYAGYAEPLLVTFDPKQAIDPAKVTTELRLKLPKLRPTDFYQKTRYRQIQGQRNMWFCGTDTSLTGHEGAVVSGMVIAHRLGAAYPFPGNTLAAIQYNVIKDLMGVQRDSERARAWFSELVFSMGKRFSMHKTQSHKFIKDMIV